MAVAKCRPVDGVDRLNSCITTYGSGKDVDTDGAGVIADWEATLWGTTNLTAASCPVIQLDCTSISARFTPGEAVTWNAGGDSGVFYGHSVADASPANNTYIYIIPDAGDPDAADALLGSSSGATADVDGVVTDEGVSPVLELFGNNVMFNDYDTIDGCTGDASYYRTIRSSSDNYHSGATDAGVGFKVTENNPGADIRIIHLEEQWSRLEDVRISAAITACEVNILALSLNQDGTVKSNILLHDFAVAANSPANTKWAYGAWMRNGTTNGTWIYNWLFLDFQISGFDANMGAIDGDLMVIRNRDGTNNNIIHPTFDLDHASSSSEDGLVFIQHFETGDILRLRNMLITDKTPTGGSVTVDAYEQSDSGTGTLTETGTRDLAGADYAAVFVDRNSEDYSRVPLDGGQVISLKTDLTASVDIDMAGAVRSIDTNYACGVFEKPNPVGSGGGGGFLTGGKLAR